MTGLSAQAKIVPLVPRLAVTTPGFVFPVPMAAIMLSPPPLLTTIFGESPQSAASKGRSVPARSSEDPSDGSISIRRGSMASQTFRHQVRARTSINAVPEASPNSMRSAPVSFRLRKSCGSATWARRAKFAGSFCLSQRIFGAVNPGRMSFPAISMVFSRPPSLARISSHCAVVDVSHQSLAGRMT